MNATSITFRLTLVPLALFVVLVAGVVASEYDDTTPTPAAATPLDGWGPPVSLDPGGLNGLNTADLEGCPSESPDGQMLFFASNRDGQIDIWVSSRGHADDAWGPPEKLPAPVNVDGSNDFCPTPLPDDELLFVSNRPGGCGDGTADIYRTRRDPALGWLEPEHLGCDLNSAGNEFSPSYVQVGGGMLFFSSDRGGEPGQDRIYVSTAQADGRWGPAVEVEELNAPGASTARPQVSDDGLVIVFDSTRDGGFGGPDLWGATRESLDAPWSEPVNLGPDINTASAETRPWLTSDGRRLYFGSNREGGEGNLDLYVATLR